MKTNPNTPSPNDTTSHKKVLLAHIMTGQTINGLQALNQYQCFALPQRMSDLKQAGIPIKSQFITLPNGKRVKEYWLEQSYINSQRGQA